MQSDAVAEPGHILEISIKNVNKNLQHQGRMYTHSSGK